MMSQHTTYEHADPHVGYTMQNFITAGQTLRSSAGKIGTLAFRLSRLLKVIKCDTFY